MKKWFVFLLFSSALLAQPVTIKSVIAITQVQQGKFFHPVAGPKGQLLLSEAGFNGLYLMNANGDIRSISDQPGSGYDPLFSTDGDYVYFRPYEYDGFRKLSSLVKKSLMTGEEQILINRQRNFSSANSLAGGGIAASMNNTLQIFDETQVNIANKTADKTVFVEKGRIALYNNSQKKILAPAGEGFYLWTSLSPDGSKILFTKAGQGTFISSLNGDILAELGYANAPQWSADGQWIVFMRDIDDGHQLIDSDIYISSVDGKTTIPVTDTGDIIEVYPCWAALDEIVFGSEDGIIYKAFLEF